MRRDAVHYYATRCDAMCMSAFIDVSQPGMGHRLCGDQIYIAGEPGAHGLGRQTDINDRPLDLVFILIDTTLDGNMV